MKRILIILVLFALISQAAAMESCFKLERVPLDTYCNIIAWAVNTSNTSQFYDDATCTIKVYGTDGLVDFDGDSMDFMGNGTYNFSYSSATTGTAYYEVTCVKDTDYGAVADTINFGTTDLELLGSINTTLLGMNENVTGMRAELAGVNDTLLDVNETIGDLNATVTDINSSVAALGETTDDINETLADITEDTGLISGFLSQLIQVSENIYGILWDSNQEELGDRFQVLVDENESFRSPEINMRTADSNLSIEQARFLTNNTLYYWKARSIDDGGYGVWSQKQEFTAAFE